MKYTLYQNMYIFIGQCGILQSNPYLYVYTEASTNQQPIRRLQLFNPRGVCIGFIKQLKVWLYRIKQVYGCPRLGLFPAVSPWAIDLI